MYSKSYRQLKHTSHKSSNRTVLQIIRRIALSTVSIKTICDYDESSCAFVVRNDLLAKAFLIERRIES